MLYGNNEVYFGHIYEAAIVGSKKLVHEFTVDESNRVVSSQHSRGKKLQFRYGENCDIGHPPRI
jgi:hypothetical protein